MKSGSHTIDRVTSGDVSTVGGIRIPLRLPQLHASVLSHYRVRVRIHLAILFMEHVDCV